MRIREWLHDNSALATVGAVVAIVLSWGILLLSGGTGRTTPPPASDKVWHFSNGTLFSASNQIIPPAPAPNGSEGPRAYVFACGVCTPSTRKIVFLEMFTPEAKAERQEKIDEARSQPGADANPYLIEELRLGNQGRLIKRVEDEAWVEWDSEPAKVLRAELNKLTEQCKAKGERLRQCLPPG